MITQKYFYDIHYHTMDLSHANLTAFINRFVKNRNLIQEFLKEELPWWKIACASVLGAPFVPLAGTLVPYSCLTLILAWLIKKQKKTRNLLSFMETSVLYDFLVAEYFLKSKEPKIVENDEMKDPFGGYTKMLICPLVMDFGYSDMTIDGKHNPDYFYNIPPQKPVVSQTSDLFKAIRTYYDYGVTYNEVNGWFDIQRISPEKKEHKLFEIFPFMGINTKNYTIAEITRMLNKYFVNFSRTDTAQQRHDMLSKAIHHFNGEIENNEENCHSIFAGIKLYPPLGFDPWPAKHEIGLKGETERNKTELLYEWCVEKNIPITVHCSTGGFIAEKDYLKITSPERWEPVLKKYSMLKINFAHLGDGNKEWTETILKLASEKKYNVYTDFSSKGAKPGYYKELADMLKDKERAMTKMLYGSDFMINLLKVDSLNQYMQTFFKTMHIKANQKKQLAHHNPEKFLFG